LADVSCSFWNTGSEALGVFPLHYELHSPPKETRKSNTTNKKKLKVKTDSDWSESSQKWKVEIIAG
jgi:hypothetical protein